MSERHSTPPPKPSKPSDDFPLFPHATGRWAKKIGGKMQYFGRWDDPDAALRNYHAFQNGDEPAPSQKAKPKPRQRRTKRPRPDGSPLFLHASGRWAKKIRGKLHYFGRGCHEDALTSYNHQKDDLHAGRVPREEQAAALTVYQLFAKFLTAKMHQRDNGELAPRSFNEYGAICRRMQKVFGKTRLVSDLTPDDFAKLRTNLAKSWGQVRLKCEIIRARTPFNWAAKMQLIPTPIMFGEGFKVPSAKTLRTHRAKDGPKMFQADEIRRLLDAAGQPLKAMILLGVNCGYGNNDVALLPLDALDLDGGWVSFARPKTGIGRRCPLWPETVEALRDWLTRRPAPKDEAHAPLAFITYKRGSWADAGDNRALSHETRKLLDGLAIDGHRGFYCLRHTFQTIGDESGDFIAVRTIMGHTFSTDISATYRERVSDDRLRKVTDHVRVWLFKPAGDGAKAGLARDEKPQPQVVG